jgi:hypothetical protein
MKEGQIMPLIQLLEVLVVVGVLLWLVNRFIPMQSSIKSILNGVVVIAVVLWVLNVFGYFIHFPESTLAKDEQTRSTPELDNRRSDVCPRRYIENKVVVSSCGRTEFYRTSSDKPSNPNRRAMNYTPTYKVTVISRTARAVNYQHRGGATKLDFAGTELMPQANGQAKVESKKATSKSKWNLAICKNPRLSVTNISLISCGQFHLRDGQ